MTSTTTTSQPTVWKLPEPYNGALTVALDAAYHRLGELTGERHTDLLVAITVLEGLE